MAIYKPGEKFRSSYLLSRHSNKRGLVALLSLTAMVDMFTVLVIFLLQNYSSTGEIIFIPKEVKLPKAEKTKELKPAVVVTISTKEILVDKISVISFEKLKAQEDWNVKPLYDEVKKGMERAKEKHMAKLQTGLKRVLDKNKDKKAEEDEKDPWRKVTVQSDKSIDFLSVKKVMFTVTEAGAGEINFAVMKQPDKK